MSDGLPIYINRIQTFLLSMILIGSGTILGVIQMNYKVTLKGFWEKVLILLHLF